ncbi:hypothetical protein AMS68_000660 [Peltaster fructicola]|uniref:Homeobox domain-containing protein n=1 Tax=Peltaster fructicola TaxID=286661 RepID=A0A6H0XK83_9PEZI|nr:hypothetical protein AMS68_000660 [Peltaster fructicola]
MVPMYGTPQWTHSCTQRTQACNEDGHTGNLRSQPSSSFSRSHLPTYSLDFLDFPAQPKTPDTKTSFLHQKARSASTSSSAVTRPISWNSGSQARSTSEFHESSDDAVYDDKHDYERQPSTAWDYSNDSALAKRKMKRFRLTHDQTRFLMNEFVKQPNPDSAHRHYLSKEIPGLSPRQVQVWFQNRRAKLKRLSPNDRENISMSRTIVQELDPTRQSHVAATNGSRTGNDSINQPEFSSLQRTTTNDSVVSRLSTTEAQSAPSRVGIAQAAIATAEKNRKRRVRIRRETTLVFGREVTIYVEEDAGDDTSELDALSSYSPDSECEEEQEVGPVRAFSLVADVPTMSPYNDGHTAANQSRHQHSASWQMDSRPVQRAERRTSMHSFSQSELSAASSRQRPAYMSRPSWLACTTSAEPDQPRLSTAWYQSQNTMVQDRS